MKRVLVLILWGVMCLACGPQVDGPTVGPIKTVLIMVDNRGEGPKLPSQTEALTLMEQARGWLKEASYGQTWLEALDDPDLPATIVGPITLGGDVPPCDTPGFLTTLAKMALAHPVVEPIVGPQAGEVDRVMVMLGGFECPDAAGMGGSYQFFEAGGHRYRASAGYIFAATRFSGIAHELLHAMGLNHGFGLSCPPGATRLDACEAVEGKTVLSLMGSRHEGQLDVGSLHDLGWLECEPAPPGTQPWRLDAVELPNSGAPRCLAIPVEGGDLLLEHRAYHGMDAKKMGNLEIRPSIFQGVSIYYRPRRSAQDRRERFRTFLLSMGQLTPDRPCGDLPWEDCARSRAALLEGQTYTHFDGTRITLTEHRPYSSLLTIRSQ